MNMMTALEAPTFDQAVASYLHHGGEARFMPKLLERFGGQPVAMITPMAVRQAAEEMLPTAAGQTRNRHVLGPMRAVLYHAHELGWRSAPRIRPFPRTRGKKREPATRKWMERFIDQCDADGLDHLAALVLFMNLTAARISEAIRVTGEHVDFGKRKVVLARTKTEENSERMLPDHLIERMRALDPQPGERVFRYTSRFSVNERIRAVCRRAELPYKSSHVVGRHAFATNCMNAGLGVRVAMAAGGWKSSSIFLETYTHTIDAGRTVMDAFNRLHHQDQF